MTKTIDTRLAEAESKIAILTQFVAPEMEKPAKLGWKRLFSVSAAKDLIYIIGLPATVFGAYLTFDKEVLSWHESRETIIQNATLERLDKLQDINSELYQLQTEGKGKVAFAIIEAKRGLIARLTDSVYAAWEKRPEMLGRYDLNALAEALLVQKRTGHALSVAQSVDTTEFSVVDQIDQDILKARIQFELGPVHDMENARDHLRSAVGKIEGIERKSKRTEMLEKIVLVRLSNEFWRNTECSKLKPLAESLTEIVAELKDIGPYEDRFGTAFTLEAVGFKCNQ